MPEREDSLAAACGRTHNEDAHRLHVKQRRIGHLWQNRFHSCPLEGRHLWDAVLYVEMNPVGAGMVQDAAEWQWSSASAHLTGEDPWRLVDLAWWHDNCEPGWWPDVLAAGFQNAALAARIREATRTGRPLGGDTFVKELERKASRRQRRGRKPKPEIDGRQMNLVIT